MVGKKITLVVTAIYRMISVCEVIIAKCRIYHDTWVPAKIFVRGGGTTPKKGTPSGEKYPNGEKA